MRELAPGAVPVGLTPTPSAFHDDLADLVDGDADAVPAKAEAASAPIAPVFERAAAPAPQPKSIVEPAPASNQRSPATPAMDFGSFIPASAEPIGMTSPRAIPLSVGADLRSFEPGKATGEPLLPRAFDLGMPVARDSAPVPAPAPVEVVPVPVAPAVEAVTEGAEPEDVADPVAAAQSALGALAMGLANPTQSNVAIAAPATELAPSLSSTVSFDDVPASATERRSLDDTIVGMLRPMIKDWLDDNLPDMVGKALHQELEDRRRGKI